MNLKKNIIWSILDFLVIPVGMIITVPIVIGGLGAETYGVFIFIASLIGINAIFNVGFGDTAVKYISHHLQRKEYSLAIETQKTITFCSLIMGIIASSLIFFNLNFISKLFNISEIINIDYILKIASLILCIKLVESIYIATLRSIGNYEAPAKITIISKICNLIFMVASIKLGFGLLGMVFSMLVTSFSSLCVLYITTCLFFNSAMIPLFSKKVFLTIYNFSGWSWIQGLSGIIYANADKFIISYIYDMKILAIYGICLQVVQNLHSIYSAASHTLFPLISRVYADSGVGQKARNIFIFADGLITIVACIPSVFIAFYAFDILDLWVGNDIAIKAFKPLAILSLVYCLFSINSISTFYIFNGVGEVKFQAFISLFAALLMLISCFILIPAYGVIGAALCRLPDAIIRIGIKIYAGNYIFGISNKRYVFDFTFFLITFFMLINFLDFFVNYFIDTNNLLFSVGAIPLILLYSFLSILLGYLYHRKLSDWPSISKILSSKNINLS